MGRMEENIEASRDIGFEWCEMAADYESLNTLKFMELVRLDRIADALESIDRDLKNLALSKPGKL